MSRCTRGRWKTRTGGETRPRRQQRSHGRATAALQPTTGATWATWATCWRRTPRTCCTICSTISTGSGPGDLTDHGDRQRSAAARSAPAPRSDRRRDQHRGATTAAAYPPGQRPRRSDPRPAARSAPATAPPGQRDQRRGLSFYWHMNDAQRAKLDTDKLKGHRREIIEIDRIRTAPRGALS